MFHIYYYTGSDVKLYLLRVVGLVVAELSLLLQDLVHLGGVCGSTVAAIRGRGGSGHGQNGGEHKLKAHTVCMKLVCCVGTVPIKYLFCVGVV